MPLNFFKKSRIYNVTSKNLFVASVHHLLDTSTSVDCTLSADSTGLECLENVCQRLSINQPEFFGLRYVLKGSRSEELRWVDLDAPLSRQLEKYSTGLKLYLHVQYYIISGVSLLEDEVTREYYFLQLKSDVIDGRIQCDARQAILLALYCRQAQYDNENDQNTIDCLKNLLPFPKEILDFDSVPENLIHEILHQNPGLLGLNQSAAEECFIAVSQQIDGYGQEKFHVRDSDANELHLGLSVNGIATIYIDKMKFYPWHEVTNVIQVKRNFIIECGTNKLQFVFVDTDSSLYFYRQCILQHFFYTKYEQNVNATPTTTILTGHHSQGLSIAAVVPSSSTNLFQNYSETDTQEDEHLYYEKQKQQQLLDNKISSNISLATTGSSAIRNQQFYEQQQQQEYQHFLQQQHQSSNAALAANEHLSHFSTDHIDNRIQSTSCLDLSNNNYNAQEKERQEILKANLPSYQPAPDYETAIRYKASSNSNEMHQIILPPMLYQGGSQPDVHQIPKENPILNHLIHHQQPSASRYPDVAQVLRNEINTNLYSNLDLVQQLQMMRLKPPPPYPANRLSSTSTPDLAVAACNTRTPLGYRGNNYVSGSSPDLVSTRTHILNSSHPPQYHPAPIHYQIAAGHSQPYISHGTFENLPSALMLQTVYRHQQPSQHSQHETNLHKSAGGINGSIEPIYENVPFLCNSQQLPLEIKPKANIPSNDVIRQNHQEMSHEQPIVMTTTPTQLTPSYSMKKNESAENFLKNRSVENFYFEERAAQIAQPQSTQHLSAYDSGKFEPSKLDSSSHTTASTPSLINSSSHQSSAYSTNVNNSTASTTTLNQKEKRKKRWGILGGRSSKNSTEKKSATLGREKNKKKEKDEAADELRQRHRWSTGLSKLQPLSASYSKDKLCQILDSKLKDPQLYMEFERIPKRRDDARYDCALLDENKINNGDDQFLPYDENRVRITPTMDNRHGYVNASHISATVGTQQRFYILGQSPSNLHTTKIFWQTVWEADVYLLVQLSDEMIILPTSNTRIQCGQFQIYQEFSQKSDRCITSKLRLYHQQSRRYRSVWYLTFNDWAEQNCPNDVGLFLDFLEELNSVRSASINEVPPGHNSNPPIFIHCREGTGRSGVTLVGDLLLYTLDHNQDLDIPRVISELRHQRDNVIPSLAQYKFIYALLITYLKRTRLI